MLDNIPEREQPEEPRRGVAPFAEGIEKVEFPNGAFCIESKDFQFGDLGTFTMSLFSSRNPKYDANEDDKAYTVDLAGGIQRGKLRDFLKAGYYTVFLCDVRDEKESEERRVLGDGQEREELKVNLWLENTETIIVGDLLVEDAGLLEEFTAANFDRRDYKNESETFVLPNNPEILQAIRLNVATV